jgi:predicted dehydrogenase
MLRRKFLQFGTAAATAASYSRILGANDRIGMALIGSGRRGREVMKAFQATGRADLNVICDVYDVQRERARTMLVADGRDKPFECVSHEFALARGGVDAVLIATPDHWHLDLATAAFQAGKHVYLEKPASHHFHEGAKLLRAARTSGRVCSVGTQQRSGAHYKQAREQYFSNGDNGKLGKVLFVRTWWSNFPWQARNIPAQAKPVGLDWLRFLGSTPFYEYNHARYDSWRYFPEYGGGVLADILNHWADVAIMMMNDAPADCVATGGIFHASNGRVNPDTVNAIVRFRKGWNLTFESSVHSLRDDRPGVLFQGTEGSLEITRTDFVFRANKGSSETVTVQASGSLETAHATDFLDSIRDGRKPSADIDVALDGLLPCHMARAAYWSGKRVQYDAGRNEIVDI